MGPTRPSHRSEFGVAIICALTIEADAVQALFDNDWDANGHPYGKAPGDLNTYSLGSIGLHNVVLVHMPGMGMISASRAAAHLSSSYRNIKLALVVGICGVVPFPPGTDKECILGDVVISTGVIQHDFGRQFPERFVRKDGVLESLGRPSSEIRALLQKLEGLRGQDALEAKIIDYLSVIRSNTRLAAHYPRTHGDRLFVAGYRHLTDGMSCEDCGCNGEQVQRRRLDGYYPQVTVHFGLVASGDTVMKSGLQRDATAQRDHVVAFEMESAGVWDSFPCVVIKGACDYADSHKTKSWQRYAAATAAACAKAFLDYWTPSTPPQNGR